MDYDAESCVSKQLYLIRHGESLHNFFARQTPGKDPYYWDATLSEIGREQVQGLRDRVSSLDVEIVVVSPLTRALLTCLGAFGNRSLPIMVNPMCREKLENACDIGTPKDQIINQFPNIDWTLLENDVWWYVPDHVAITVDNYKDTFTSSRWREPDTVVANRVSMFKSWLLKRKETKIAVVAHSSFLKAFLGATELMPNCHVEPFVLEHPFKTTNSTPSGTQIQIQRN